MIHVQSFSLNRTSSAYSSRVWPSYRSENNSPQVRLPLGVVLCLFFHQLRALLRLRRGVSSARYAASSSSFSKMPDTRGFTRRNVWPKGLPAIILRQLQGQVNTSKTNPSFNRPQFGAPPCQSDAFVVIIKTFPCCAGRTTELCGMLV